MAIYLRTFVLVLFLAVISALPLEKQQDESINDLLSVDSTLQDETASGDDLTRNRRHGGYGNY